MLFTIRYLQVYTIILTTLHRIIISVTTVATIATRCATALTVVAATISIGIEKSLNGEKILN